MGKRNVSLFALNGTINKRRVYFYVRDNDTTAFLYLNKIF